MAKVEDLLRRAHKAMDGDSNDAEHDVLFELVEFLEQPKRAAQRTGQGRAVVTVDLDASELATVLAALRLFQRTYEDCDAVAIARDWPHFEEDEYGDVSPEPLGSEDIDTLCEQINCAEVRP